jgi:hypothetical protein
LSTGNGEASEGPVVSMVKVTASVVVLPTWSVATMDIV